jgi:hypothetical protein
VGLVDLLRLLGLLVLPLLHCCRVHLHHWGLDLVTGVCGKGSVSLSVSRADRGFLTVYLMVVLEVS